MCVFVAVYSIIVIYKFGRLSFDKTMISSFYYLFNQVLWPYFIVSFCIVISEASQYSFCLSVIETDRITFFASFICVWMCFTVYAKSFRMLENLERQRHLSFSVLSLDGLPFLCHSTQSQCADIVLQSKRSSLNNNQDPHSMYHQH